jgi:opacity protein-like surface antigen
MMKSLLAALTLTTALTLPAIAAAKPVTLTTTLNRYGGNGAYLAYYVTDAQGHYLGSLWMAGGRTKYYHHLSDWYRATRGNPAEINGITGASVGSGRQMQVTLDLSDALFDAGYVLHIDAAAENFRESPSDVTVNLTTAGAGTPVRGRGYVASFQYDM